MLVNAILVGKRYELKLKVVAISPLCVTLNQDATTITRENHDDMTNINTTQQ
jgi:hypothetical protein